MRVDGLMDELQVLGGKCFTLMVITMRVIGSETNLMVKMVYSNPKRRAVLIKEIGEMVCKMVLEKSFGTTMAAHAIRGIISLVSRRASGSTHGQMGRLIEVNGKTI